MRRNKITTTDERIYKAFINLRHQKEVILEKPFEYKALDTILRNNTNIVAISNGRSVILKKISDVDFDIYLKKIW
jgi:hypothetical protein